MTKEKEGGSGHRRVESGGDNGPSGPRQKQDIIRMKEKNNQELVNILRMYLGRVITLAFVNTDTYQLLMLCADYKGILDLMFHF